MNWTVALKGFAKWAMWADCEDPDEPRKRLLHCAVCQSMMTFTEDEMFAEAKPMWAMFRKAPMTVWCGRPGIERPNQSCGCLVGREAGAWESALLTIKGRPVLPDGKVEKQPATCPQGKW